MAKREKFQKTNAMRELERAGVSFTYQEFEEDDLTRGLGLRMALEAGVDPATMCCKTGTAEVGDGTSHAWFTGFLLDDAHPYAFVVLVENAGGGLTNAGAVANTVLQAAVNK